MDEGAEVEVLWGQVYGLMEDFLQRRDRERERERRERQGRIDRAREEERQELKCAKEKVEKEKEYKRTYEENRKEMEDADFFASMVERTALVRHSTPPQQGPLDYSVPNNKLTDSN